MSLKSYALRTGLSLITLGGTVGFIEGYEYGEITCKINLLEQQQSNNPQEEKANTNFYISRYRERRKTTARIIGFSIASVLAGIGLASIAIRKDDYSHLLTIINTPSEEKRRQEIPGL